MKIQGKSARMFVHSATIPYTFPNITSANNALVCDAGAVSVTIQLDTGVYSLLDMQDAINSKVNAALHNAGQPLLQDAAGTANFCVLTPDNQRNRVLITFSHLDTGCSFQDAASTMAPVLGFDQLIGFTAPVLIASTGAPLSLNVTWIDDGGSSSTGAIAIGSGTFTAASFMTYINGAVKTLTSGAVTTIISALTVTPSAYVATEYVAVYTYTASTGVYAHFAAGQDAVLQSAVGGTPAALRASRWTGEGPTHVATSAAQVNKVTELAVALPGVTHGAYNTAGDATTAVIARFPVTGAPGDLIVYAPDVPLYSNVDHLLGTAVSTLTVMLCDQHGRELDSLQDEAFSVCLCVQVEP